MSDIAHIITDMLIRELEVLISREFKKANRQIRDKADEYFKSYEAKEKIKRDQLKRGVITLAEFIAWRKGQLLIDARWNEMRNTLAEDFHNANKIAQRIMLGGMPDIYALNHSYGTYEVEHASLLDTSYTLYSREAVEKVLSDHPLLPSVREHGMTFDFTNSDEWQMPRLGKKAWQRVADLEDVLWNRTQIQSVMLQGILQGMPIPELATKLEAVTERNHAAAIRNARTMATNVQNAGRIDSYKRAEKLGIKLKKQWIATLDGRTRHEHRLLDGQTAEVDEPFTVEGMEIDFPGDPHAKAQLVYNCRCTMRTQLKGFEVDVTDLTQRNNKLGDMSYQEWVNAKAESEPIDRQERIAKIMKGRYGKLYRR